MEVDPTTVVSVWRMAHCRCNKSTVLGSSPLRVFISTNVTNAKCVGVTRLLGSIVCIRRNQQLTTFLLFQAVVGGNVCPDARHSISV